MKAKRNAPRGPRRHDLLDIDWQAVARGEIKLTKEQEAAAMDAWAAQADAKAARAAATIPKVDSAKIEAWRAANSGKKVVKDFYNGSADLILCHAKWYCETKAEKIEYLKWALDCIYSSARYVLREQIDAIEKKKNDTLAKDAEEYSRNPKRFEQWHRYYKVDDPWEIIEAEIKRLAEPKPEKKARKKQGINWEFLDFLERKPDLTISCSSAYTNLNISPRKFYAWHNEGRKICTGYNIMDWKDVDGRDKKLKKVWLKVSDDSLYVVNKDLIEFLKFTEPGCPKKPISK